jgi:glycine hydroxymethyltransferase
LLLVDLTSKDISGKDAERLLDRANITCNKNGIPYDTRSPLVTSGVRFGTPALTTRGMREKDMAFVAEVILDALRSQDDDVKIKAIAQRVRDYCADFPLFK